MRGNPSVSIVRNCFITVLFLRCQIIQNALYLIHNEVSKRVANRMFLVLLIVIGIRVAGTNFYTEIRVAVSNLYWPPRVRKIDEIPTMDRRHHVGSFPKLQIARLRAQKRR